MSHSRRGEFYSKNNYVALNWTHLGEAGTDATRERPQVSLPLANLPYRKMLSLLRCLTCSSTLELSFLLAPDFHEDRISNQGLIKAPISLPFCLSHLISQEEERKKNKNKTKPQAKLQPSLREEGRKKKKKTIQPETKSELHKSRTPNYEEFALEADTEDEKYKASECRDFCCSQKAVRNPSKWLYISQTFLQGKKKKKK